MVTRLENGLCTWIMSNDSSSTNFLIRGRNHIDRETRAIDPPPGIGTGRPIGMNLSSVTFCKSEHGPMMRTVCPHLVN